MAAKKREPLERLRTTKAGHSQKDLASILEHYGFECVRTANHGLIYEHPELAAGGLRNEASIMIPRGRELRKVYAADVLKSIEALRQFRKERDQHDDPS